MDIQALIDRNYATVSILEETAELTNWMQQRDYYVICDEEIKPVGIVTVNDIACFPFKQLIDCDITKPTVGPFDSLQQVYTTMKECRSAYLPVYNFGEFVGVISLWSIAERLFEKQLTGTF